MLKELVELVVKKLVDHPDKVSVTEISGEKAIIVELRVDQEDLGKVIGKEGRNIKAFENYTNVKVIVDETPETVVLSSFDPVKRENCTCCDGQTDT